MTTTSHLLLEVFPVKATLLQDGDQYPLGDALQLSVLMLEAPPGTPLVEVPSADSETLTWLGLRIGDVLDVPLAKESKVVFMQPSGYTVPAAGAASRSGEKGGSTVADGLVRIELGAAVTAEDRETLDSILSSWTAFDAGRGVTVASGSASSSSSSLSRSTSRLASVRGLPFAPQRLSG